MIVVFDIGNVLVRWNPRNLIPFKDEARMEHFLGDACQWTLSLTHRRGLLDGNRGAGEGFPRIRA